MVHVFTSRIQTWCMCSILCPCVETREVPQDLCGLRLLFFGPKQQCASWHQLDLKWALTEAQVLQNSVFSQNYMALYALLQPHLVFPLPQSKQYNYLKRCWSDTNHTINKGAHQKANTSGCCLAGRHSLRNRDGGEINFLFSALHFFPPLAECSPHRPAF